MRVYKSIEDHQRPGQRIVNYAYMNRKIPQKTYYKVDPLETWLWNLSEIEFKKVMEWSPE